MSLAVGPGDVPVGVWPGRDRDELHGTGDQKEQKKNVEKRNFEHSECWCRVGRSLSITDARLWPRRINRRNCNVIVIVNIDQLCVSIVQTLHGLHSANTININMVQIWPCKDSQLWLCPKIRLEYFFTNIQELQDSLKIPNDLLINLDSVYQIIFV